MLIQLWESRRQKQSYLLQLQECDVLTQPLSCHYRFSIATLQGAILFCMNQNFLSLYIFFLSFFLFNFFIVKFVGVILVSKNCIGFIAQRYNTSVCVLHFVSLYFYCSQFSSSWAFFCFHEFKLLGHFLIIMMQLKIQ